MIRVFRIILGIAVFLVLFTPLGAESAAFPDPLPGEFVFYRDHTWKEPAWTGFLRYDESTYAGMLLIPSSGTRVSILFRGEVSGDEFVLTGQKIITKITNDDVPAVNYLMRLIESLHVWKAAASRSGIVSPDSDRSPLLPARVRTVQTSDMFGGDINLTHAAEIPVFGLYSLASSDEKPLLVLERHGMIRPGHDTDFFAFEPKAPAKSGKNVVLEKNPVRQEFLVDGLRVPLDGQWSAVAENTFFLGDTAMLVIDSVDTAQAGIPADTLYLDLVRFFSRSTRTVWADPGKTRGTGTAERFLVENVFFDSETGLSNRDIKLCLPGAGGSRVQIISLTVGEVAYKANQAYFDALLSGISK